MISRLKRKVILLTTASLFALLILIVSGMNVISFVSLIDEADDIIEVISDFGGRFPGVDGDFPERGDGETQKMRELPPRFSGELQFETRYFFAVLTNKGDVVSINTARIASVDGDEVIEYAKKALSGGKEKGFMDNFRYNVEDEGDNYLIIFLDCTRKLDSFETFLYSSIITSFAGFLVVAVIIIIISGRIIRPIAVAYEKQKRFITDAGHELKTPLAIINANIDLVEDEVSDRECINDMRKQTARLKDLTDDLVTLSRIEEGSAAIVKSNFSAAKAVEEAVAGFNALAQNKGIKLSVIIEPDIEINADEKAFNKLVSILLDNAVKYTPAGENIMFELKRQSKSVVINCKNTTADEITKENAAHVFDRFYRTDTSRNSDTGGHGIGLSIAKAIVEAHGGKITASAPDEHIFVITAVFPQ